MAQLANLKIHDMPSGTVAQDAFAIQWFQDILDFWYHLVPFSATVASLSITNSANASYITLPSDFILDVRNGYFVESVPGDTASLRRAHRLPLQKFLNRKLIYQRSTNVQFPLYYCIQGVSTVTATLGQQLMQLTPVPSIVNRGTLWYYQLPPVLEANDKPLFPSDYVCIEYVRIRALEWAGAFDPGTAQKFCDKVVAGMKVAGLMNEAEDDEVPMDELVHVRGRQSGVYSWMGTV